MRPDRMTTKSQEAFRDGGDLASRRGNPELVPEHLVRAMLAQDGGIALPLFQKAGGDPARRSSAARRAHRQAPEGRAAAPSPGSSRRTLEVAPQGGGRGQGAEGRLRLGRALRRSRSRSTTARCQAAFEASGGVTYDKLLQALASVRGAQRVDRSRSRREVPGAREVHARSHRRGAQGQDRSRHRPRRGDPPRDAGALAPHQEQPRAHRRARRRQDGHRRGHRAAHRPRRRARVAQEQAARRRSTWARSSPAPSTAASSRIA